MDDFEKWWAPTWPSNAKPFARAAYEAGQASLEVALLEFDTRLAAAQKVIEAAEAVLRCWEANQHFDRPIVVEKTLARALATYHAAVTKDDQKPSQRDIQSSVDTPHEPGSEERHVIDLRRDGWTIKHPLKCREGDLFACKVNKAAEHELMQRGPLGRFYCDIDESGRFVLGSALRGEK